MFKNNIKVSYVSLIISCVNLVLYHLPLFQFATDNLDYKSWDGILTLASLVVIILVLNALIFYIILFIAPFIGKSITGSFRQHKCNCCIFYIYLWSNN